MWDGAVKCLFLFLLLEAVTNLLNFILNAVYYSDTDHAGALIGARNVRKLGQPTGPHARTYGHGTTPAATPGTPLCALGSS
jgi:hypothetical protein